MPKPNGQEQPNEQVQHEELEMDRYFIPRIQPVPDIQTMTPEERKRQEKYRSLLKESSQYWLEAYQEKLNGVIDNQDLSQEMKEEAISEMLMARHYANHPDLLETKDKNGNLLVKTDSGEVYNEVTKRINNSAEEFRKAPQFKSMLDGVSKSEMKAILDNPQTFLDEMDNQIKRKAPENNYKRNDPQKYKNDVARSQALLEQKYNENEAKEYLEPYFSQIMAAQMLANNPKLGNRKQYEDNGKTVYIDDLPELNISSVEADLRESSVYWHFVDKMSREEMTEVGKNPHEFIDKVAHYTEIASDKGKGIFNPVIKDQVNSYLSAMIATGTGKVMGFSRSKNSQAYNDMISAMQDINNVDDTKPEEREEAVLKAVEATMAYLSDKKKVRSTDEGKIRFENSLKFLGAAMPPNEFKEYCNDINRERNAMAPESSGHIDPDLYLPRRPVKELAEETQKKMLATGEYSNGDMALIQAAYNLSPDHHIDDNGKRTPVNDNDLRQIPDEQMISPAELKARAKEVQQDKKFQDWIDKQTPADRKALVEDNKCGPAYRIGNHDKELGPSTRDKEKKKKLEEQKEAIKITRQKMFLKDVRRWYPEEYEKVFANDIAEMNKLKEENPKNYSNDPIYKEKKREFSASLDKYMKNWKVREKELKEQAAQKKNEGPKEVKTEVKKQQGPKLT